MNTQSIVEGTYWHALKTAGALNIRKGVTYLLDRPYPESSVMLIKDPKGGKGRSTMLLNGRVLVAQGLREGWIERAPDGNTAKAAVAWTFGKTAEEYAPAIET